MAKTTVYQKNQDFPDHRKTTMPEKEFLNSRLAPTGESERIFTTRLHLRGPVNRELHAGKYVVMTMSRANLKSIEYAVAYVEIVPRKIHLF